MCLYPKLIINRKYIPNKKNNYNAPQIPDNRVLYVPVGCTKCMECKKQKARQWSIRLQEEIKTNTHGEFVTLTFNTKSLKKLAEEITGLEGYELENEIATLAIRRFLERWRKKYGISIKHWLVTELGSKQTEHIHVHGILFKNKYKHNLKGIKEQYLQEQKKDIEKIWGYGYVYIGDYVNEETVNYCVKYFTKTDLKHKEYNSKILTSAGIGNNYTNTINAQLNKYNIHGETKETYTTRNGKKINLPIYWRNKIYTDHEREQLWLQRLDKETRYVDGVKIDISKTETKYYEILKIARNKNARLGYGNNEKNWNRIRYENDRRKIIQNKRLKNLEEPPEETIFGFKKYKLNKCST